MNKFWENSGHAATIGESPSLQIGFVHSPELRPLPPVHQARYCEQVRKEDAETISIPLGKPLGLLCVAFAIYLIVPSPVEQASAVPIPTEREIPAKPSKKKEQAGISIFRPNAAATAAPSDPLPQNEAAPVSSRQLTPAMARAYIAEYSNLAVSEMNHYGVPASISLAQGLVESRGGDSKLARRNNNHFGIKCFSGRCKKGHCSNFTDDTHKDFFRIFAHPRDSWRAHSVMISTGRYTRLKQYGRDYRKWAYGLKAVGYATDATYAEKLIGMIEEYDLQRFDK